MTNVNETNESSRPLAELPWASLYLRRANLKQEMREALMAGDEEKARLASEQHREVQREMDVRASADAKFTW